MNTSAQHRILQISMDLYRFLFAQSPSRLEKFTLERGSEQGDLHAYTIGFWLSESKEITAGDLLWPKISSFKMYGLFGF